MDEFALIRRYFSSLGPSIDAVALGVGDDCALLNLAPGEQLATSVDTVVEGRHFPTGADPELVAWRTLGPAVSDLAAMGARPLGFALALTLPKADSQWLARFAAALEEAAHACSIPLIGGDTTRGPLVLSVTVYGAVPTAQSLRRSRALLGDEVWVSGYLGSAACGLRLLQNGGAREEALPLQRRYTHPLPRLALGERLRRCASAAIDISDGLLADLQHLCQASQVGALLDLEQLPIDPLLLRFFPVQARDFALYGGDDYELCFTVPPSQSDSMCQLAEELELPLTCIGRIIAQRGLFRQDGASQVPLTVRGYNHFS